MKGGREDVNTTFWRHRAIRGLLTKMKQKKLTYFLAGQSLKGPSCKNFFTGLVNMVVQVVDLLYGH